MSTVIAECQGVDLVRLLSGVGEGDPEAWSELLSRYGGLSRRVCQQYRMTHEQTEDVMQTAWLRLFIHAHELRDAAGLASWLRTTIARECLAVRRRDQREVPSDKWRWLDTLQPADRAAEIDRIEERLDLRRQGGQLREAVATLPQRERILIELLLATDGLKYAEISDRLDMPVGAIGPVRQRALRHLRAWLDAADPADADRTGATW